MASEQLELQFQTPRAFVSPLSITNNYNLEWTKVDPRWGGIQALLSHLTDRDAEIADVVSCCQAATSQQLCKAFWPNPSNGAERLKLLARHGFLIQHRMTRKGVIMPIYTLGPLGASVLNIEYRIWWKGATLEAVLCRLVLAQLYFRLRQAGQARVLQAPAPFTGVIALEDHEYPVLVVRTGRPLTEFLNAKRLFVVAETEDTLIRVAAEIRVPARFTTDERLYTKPFPELFLIYKDGQLKVEGEQPAE